MVYDTGAIAVGSGKTIMCVELFFVFLSSYEVMLTYESNFYLDLCSWWYVVVLYSSNSCNLIVVYLFGQLSVIRASLDLLFYYLLLIVNILGKNKRNCVVLWHDWWLLSNILYSKRYCVHLFNSTAWKRESSCLICRKYHHLYCRFCRFPT